MNKLMQIDEVTGYKKKNNESDQKSPLSPYIQNTARFFQGRTASVYNIHSPSSKSPDTSNHYFKDSKSKKQFIGGQDKESNRKMNEIQSLEEIKNRYLTIEQILNEQNINLKTQANYLVEEIRRLIRREKKYKQELKTIRQNYKELQQKYQKIANQNQQIHQFVEEKIMLIIGMTKINNLQSIISETLLISRQLCDFFKIDFEIKLPLNQTENFLRQQKKQDKIRRIEPKIDQLNDQFEALMFEYKKTNKSQIRKECIRIAKQIKRLKLQSPPADRQKNELTDIITQSKEESEYHQKGRTTDRKSRDEDSLQKIQIRRNTYGGRVKTSSYRSRKDH